MGRVEIATLGSTSRPQGFSLSLSFFFQGKPWGRCCPWVRLGRAKEGGMVIGGKEREISGCLPFTVVNRSVKGLGKGSAKFRTGEFRPGIAFTVFTN